MTSIVSTKEALRNSVTSMLKHNIEVPEFNGEYAEKHKRRYLQSIFDSKMEEELKQAGFMWFVTAKLLLELKCAASVGVPKYADYDYAMVLQYIGLGDRGPVIGVRVPCVYDDVHLPNWVLPRIKTATELGIRGFTLHSNEKLTPKLRDPILVGWKANFVLFMQDKLDAFSLSKEGYGSVKGVVIAIWDADKEVDFL